MTSQATVLCFGFCSAILLLIVDVILAVKVRSLMGEIDYQKGCCTDALSEIDRQRRAAGKAMDFAQKTAASAREGMVVMDDIDRLLLTASKKIGRTKGMLFEVMTDSNTAIEEAHGAGVFDDDEGGPDEN